MDYLKQIPGGTISNPTAKLIQVAKAQILWIYEYFAAQKERYHSYPARERKAA